MNKYCLSIVFVGVVLINSPVCAMTLQWETGGGGNNHYYEAVSGDVSWSEALLLAESSSFNGVAGHLVTITSVEENDWIWTNLGAVNAYFLGGTDQIVEGSWEWITGESWSYVNWNSGEPNDVPWALPTGEDALQFADNGKWNDVPVTGYISGGYIIEYEAVPVPAAVWLFGSGLISLIGAARRKKV